MKLRPYQVKLVNDVKRALISGDKSVCAVLSCGGGKSIIQASIAKSATDKGNRVLFIVHRKELCDQIRATFKAYGVDLSLCQISMVQTVTRKLTKIEKPQLIITDEAHHCLSRSYMNIYDYFNGVIKLGFTATPIRMNEGGLGKIFDTLVESVSTKWLIENKFLSPYEYYSVRLINTDDVEIKRGEYDKREVAELVEKRFVYGETIKNYLHLAKGKKTIVYCATIEQSKQTVEEFCKNGIKAMHTDGATPAGERERIVKKFRDGKIDVISNVDLFGEGFDVPDCECVILLRPTKSLTLFIQQSMRSMRYKENKTAIIIDHVGNVYEHGLPDDEREWDLKAKKRKIKSNEVKVKECDKCFKVVAFNCSVCKYCGYVFKETEKEHEEKETLNIKLEQITQAELLAAKPYTYYKTLNTFDELKEFQQAKKYKFSWVIRQCIQRGIEFPKKYEKMVRYLR